MTDDEDRTGWHGVVCPYCGATAQRVTGETLYPHLTEFAQHRFYACLPCGAYVGTYIGTWRPLGHLADRALRTARREAHEAIDQFWKRRQMPRTSVYGWLSRVLKIPEKRCHIGMFDVKTCRRVVDLVAEVIDAAPQVGDRVRMTRKEKLTGQVLGHDSTGRLIIRADNGRRVTVPIMDAEVI